MRTKKQRPPYHTASRKRPELPDELWEKIFEFAASQDEHLDVDSVAADFTVGTFKEKERTMILKRSSVTRARIVRVCKVWQALGARILWAHIHVVRLRKLQPVLANFTGTARGKILASYVKRLDIMGYIFEIAPWQDLIRVLPNLQILAIAAHSTPHLRVIGVLQNALTDGQGPSNCLKALIWYADLSWDFMPVKRLADLFRSLPNLQVLRWHTNQTRLTSWNREGASKDPPSLAINLESLRALRLPGDAIVDPWLLTQHFPSLIQLTCIPSERTPFYDMGGTDGWRKFMKRHGQQLQHLELQLQTNMTSNTRALEALQQHCRSLTRLDIVLDEWSDLPKEISLPSSIKTFGLSLRSPSTARAEYRHLVQVTENLDAKGLQVVQFLRKHNLDDFTTCHRLVWEQMRQVLMKKGLRIKDPKGVFLEESVESPE